MHSRFFLKIIEATSLRKYGIRLIEHGKLTVENLPQHSQELQDLLLLSEKDIQSGNLLSHEEVVRSL